MLPPWGQQTMGQGQEATTERSQFSQGSNCTLPKTWSTHRPREHLAWGTWTTPFTQAVMGYLVVLQFFFL